MEKYLEILKQCPLFFGEKSENIIKMLGCLGAKTVHYDKKQTVFYQGEKAENIGILLSGRAQIISVDYLGKRNIVSEIVKGNIFAEEFACAEIKNMPVSVVTSEVSDIMIIDCKHILYTCSYNCRFHQDMIFNLMKNLADKNIAFHQKLEIISNRTTREKLLSYLKLCSQKENKCSFTIPFDRQELADYLEVDRSGLSAEISKLKKEGIIENNKNHFELL